MKTLLALVIAFSSLTVFSQVNSVQKECQKKGLSEVLLSFKKGTFKMSSPAKITKSQDYEFLVVELDGEKCTYLFRCRVSVDGQKVKAVDYTGHSTCNMDD